MDVWISKRKVAALIVKTYCPPGKELINLYYSILTFFIVANNFSPQWMMEIEHI